MKYESIKDGRFSRCICGISSSGVSIWSKEAEATAFRWRTQLSFTLEKHGRVRHRNVVA